MGLGGTLRGGGSAVRFHDCTNNTAMTNVRDLKDMVSGGGVGFIVGGAGGEVAFNVWIWTAAGAWKWSV